MPGGQSSTLLAEPIFLRIRGSSSSIFVYGVSLTKRWITEESIVCKRLRLSGSDICKDSLILFASLKTSSPSLLRLK